MNLVALRSRQRNLRRGLTALAGLVLLVVAVPALLLQLSRALLDSPNPLTGATAPWTWSANAIKDVLTRALDQQTVLTTISRAGLVLAWLALFVIVVSVAFEVRSLRLQGLSMPRVRGLGWAQAIAQRLAAGLLALSTVLPAHIASAAPLTARAVATLAISAPHPSNASGLPPRTDAAPTDNKSWITYEVGRGDSIYAIAGRLADGDRGRTRELAQQILDRNLGHVMNDGQKFTTPGFIQIGWTLEIPSDPSRARVEPTPVKIVRVDEPTYTVQRGDSYWEIADNHLQIVLGHEPTPAEVLEETHQLIDANVERLGHRTPNTMLYPGDVLALPTRNGYHPPLGAPAKSATPPQADGPPPTTTATLPPQPPTAAPTPAPAPVPDAPTTTPTSPTETPPSTPVAAEIDAPSRETTPNPWAKLAIGSLFATGMAATVERLRRRRLARRRPGYRVDYASAAAAMTETVLHAEARPDRIAALHQLLGALAGRTRLDGDRPLVRAVQLTDTGAEMLWTAPQSTPPKPWTTTDGGWSWRTSWPNELTRQDRHRRVLPTLVPIGVRDDGAELLLDLESAGSLAVEGTPRLVEAFVRQLVLSLGATPLADNIDIITVAIDVPGASHLERIRSTPLDTAREWITTCTGETRVALTKTKVNTTLAARLLGRTNDEWEPIVVIALSCDEVAARQLAEASPPGSGSVAVVASGGAARERIVLHSEDKAEWIGLGVTFVPHLVTAEAEADLAELLEHAEDGTEEPAVLHDSPLQTQRNAAQASLGNDSKPRCYDILVRVLGEVEVQGCAEHLTEAELELLALLATVRPDGPINLDRLATLLAHDEWRTPKLRSIQSRISHLRRKLGNGSDGAPLLPDSRAATGSPSRYRISPRVVTDIDLLDHAYRLAADLPSSEATRLLRRSLELVRGKPYTACAGYSWAYDEHAASRAVQVVGDVTARLIDLFGEAGDLTGIRWAIDRAGRAVDDPMSETPYRIAERRWSEHSSTAELRDSVRAHTVRLAAFMDSEDPLG